nr:hypothetical protein [Tanacetum cinerariifolium]
MSSNVEVTYSEGKLGCAHPYRTLYKHGFRHVRREVQSNKEEYRIFRDHTYVIELDGATSVSKASVKSGGFVRYPFQLISLGSIVLTDKKYLIDVTGYVTNIGRINHQKSGSRTLDFSLVNGSEDEVSLSQAAVHADYSQAKEGTLENLLIWAQDRKNDSSTFKCRVTINDIRLRKGWNFPGCGGEKCKKGIVRKNESFWCQACENVVDHPVL